MSNINKELDLIKNAVYGKDVRGAIHDGIKKAYDDASEKGNANMEVEMARGDYNNLNDRLKDTDKKTKKINAETESNTLNKVDKNGSGQVGWANIAQDAREQIIGEVPPAVVGHDSVTTENVVNNSITYDKINFEKDISLRVVNLVSNGDFSEIDDDGAVDWFVGINSNSIEYKNDGVYWMPETSSVSSSLSSRTPLWKDELKKGNVYYLSFESKNVEKFRFLDDPIVTEYIIGDGKSVYTFTASSSRTFDLRFQPRYQDLETYVRNVSVVNMTETLGVGKEVNAEYFKYMLSVINNDEFVKDGANLIGATQNRIVSAKDLLLYDKDNVFESKNVNDALFEVKNDIDDAVDNIGSGDPKKDIETMYNVSAIEKENESLLENIKMLTNNSKSLFGIKLDKPTDRQSIRVTDNLEDQKMILHLHNRVNEGYDETSDVYLPNAESDFSDIRITDENGKILSYKTTYKTNQFDVVMDSRLGVGFPASMILETSSGSLVRTFSEGMMLSNDKGKTWELIQGLSDFDTPVLNLVTHNDTIIFNKSGLVYRSEYPYTSYEETYNLGDLTGVMIVGKGMVQHPDGDIFFGKYQNEYDIKFYKSVDDGKTWMLSADFGDAYQHVHGMFVDEKSIPIAVYAGVDGGGGIYKTTDKGDTWIELREENPNIPQATDYGARYSDELGYRFFGGETPVVGGYSLLKTFDDVNFEPVHKTGISINYIEKMNGILFATGSGGTSHRVGQVLVSYDEGESWETVYITPPIVSNSPGVNDGYRYMTVLDNQILVGGQSKQVPYLRILDEGSYAEIVVNFPKDSNYVVIESGYAYTNQQVIYNDTNVKGDVLVNFDLNEGINVLKEGISNNYFEGDFKWNQIGRHLSHFYPYVISPKDKKSISIPTLKGFEVDSSDFNVTEAGITISFWFGADLDTEINIFETDLGDVFNLVGITSSFRTNLNGSYKSQITRYVLPDAFYKIDLTIDSQGNCKAYNNGQTFSIRSYDSKDVLQAIDNSSKMTFLRSISSREENSIQHFSIRKGVVDENTIRQEFNSNITNNLF